jgi:hypothetical protein
MWHSIKHWLETGSRLIGLRGTEPAEQLPTSRGNLSPVITIVCLLADKDDRAVLGELAGNHRWELVTTENLERTAELAKRIDPQVILLDRDLSGADWRSSISACAASSAACVVLVSKVVDDYLWNDVVLNGGYEVLPKPLRDDQVLRAVSLAQTYWTSVQRWPQLRK